MGGEDRLLAHRQSLKEEVATLQSYRGELQQAVIHIQQPVVKILHDVADFHN